jgi:hypothetical protein
MEPVNAPIIMDKNGDLRNWEQQMTPQPGRAAPAESFPAAAAAAAAGAGSALRPLFGGAMQCLIPPTWRDLR